MRRIVKRIIALMCVLSLAAALLPAAFISAGADGYERKGNGFESFNKAVVALLYRKGIKTINTSKDELPSGLSFSVKMTVSDTAVSDGVIELASSRNPDVSEEKDFVNGVKIDPGASGKTFNLFGDARITDSDGIRMYLARGPKGSVENLRGRVKLQLSKSNTRGLSAEDAYKDLEQGFVFETPEYEIGGDGYVLVGYEDIFCVDGWTDYKDDFWETYAPQINAVNIVITPEDGIESSDIFYLGDLYIVRKSGDDYINVEDGCGCGGVFDLTGRTKNGESVTLKLDGSDIPQFCEKKEFTDSYGSLNTSYRIDTMLFGSGPHRIDMYVDGELRRSNRIFFDNDKPYISYSNILDGEFTGSSGTIDMTASDGSSGVDTFTVRLDGKRIDPPYAYTDLLAGTHIIDYTIKDKANHTVKDTIMFTVSEGGKFTDITGNYSVAGNGNTAEITAADSDAEWCTLYTANGMLDVTTSRNVVTYDRLDEKQPDGEEVVSTPYYSTYSAKDSKYPYMAYDVDVSTVTGKYFRTSYSGKTMPGEAVKMDVYNENTKQWDRVASVRAGNDGMVVINGTVPMADHVLDGTARVRVSLMYTDNGAKTIGWASDQQYYVEHDEWDRDLSYYFEDQVAQLVSDYKEGKVAYVVNTGDTANNMHKESQFQEVREIMNAYDANRVPFGILAGNHEVWKPNFTYWQRYFGESWFNQNDWYGGGLNDNIHHYDLITVGGRDMIFIYIGWSDETTPATVQWVKDVLETYRHRTAVMCFHGYISRNTEFVTEYVTAEDFWHRLVEPYPNLKLVLCGHEPGVAHNVRTASDGRKVNEILQCYQMDPEKSYNWRDGGWGLFRYITFDETLITNTTYTADRDYGKNYYWREEDENFTMKMSYVKNKRMLESYSFTAYSGTMSKAGNAVKEADGLFKATIGDTGSAELWCMRSDRGESAVYPVFVDIQRAVSAMPEITDISLENGKVFVRWSAPFTQDEVTGYTVTVNGEDFAAGPEERTFTKQYLPNAGEEYVVSVTLNGASGNRKTGDVTCYMGGAPAHTPMDIDGDGDITVTDALTALRAAVKLIGFDNPKQWSAANCNGDAVITAADAMMILRRAAGLI